MYNSLDFNSSGVNGRSLGMKVGEEVEEFSDELALELAGRSLEVCGSLDAGSLELFSATVQAVIEKSKISAVSNVSNFFITVSSFEKAF